MPQMTISQAAKRLGLRSSAVRYYEEIGILPAAHRLNGQRRYDEKVLYRLAVIQHAQRAGFSLTEIRQLFFGFRSDARPSERWKKLASKKLAELDALMEQIQVMRSLLSKSCDCAALDECGSKILQKYCGDIGPSIPLDSLKRKTRRGSIFLNVTSILGWSVHGLVLQPTCWPARFSCVTAIGCRQRCLVSAGGCARN